MNGVLTRLMNAPVALQRLAALLLLAAVIAAMAGIAAGMAGALAAKRAELQDLRETAGRFARMAALKETVRAIDAPAEAQSGQALFVIAESPSIARASLQSRVGAIARSHGVAMVSAGGMPDRDENGYQLIGLRADLVGAFEDVHGVIFDIEGSLPPLFVRELVLKRAGPQERDGKPVIQMTAQLQLFAAYRPPAAAAIATRKAELAQ